MRSPALGIVAITPVVFAGAVAGSPASTAPVRDSAVTPLAAVAPSPINPHGASVVAITKTPTPFHIASAAGISGPLPSAVVSSPGTLRIPMISLNAYQNAERMMAASYPGCGISWNLLAGIGRIESMHANGGATDASGSAVRPIYGPTLDGTLPGNEVIEMSRVANRVTYARAMGPMQFLPGTWSRYASDGNGDGKADVQNVFDASLAAARYLCSGGLNLRDQSQVMTAILRYNNSMAYAQNVLGWAAAYATGVVPIDLPPITGPIPPIADAHLDNYQGLGPGLPMNVLGLPANDPLALVPLADMSRTDVASQMQPNGQVFGPLPGPAEAGAPAVTQPGPPQSLPPWMPQPPQQNCAVFCLGTNPPASVQPQLPPEALPPGVVPPPAAPAPLAPGPAAEFAPTSPAPAAEAPATPTPIGPQGVGPAPGPAS
ncbi:lytic transglycosylase [Mycobacterium sp. 1274761.0]|nr:lytic transglycosylase [Mycobacterium sp. 1274761.0]